MSDESRALEAARTRFEATDWAQKWLDKADAKWSALYGIYVHKGADYCNLAAMSMLRLFTEAEALAQSEIDSLRAENERLNATFENESLKGDSHVTAADSYYEIAEILDVSDGGSVIETAQGIKEELDILRAENDNLRNGLKFYAEQEHMYGRQDQEWEIDAGWDTCSGEPGNWLFPENGDPIGIENGSVANAVLKGAIMTPDSDETVYIFPLTNSVGEPNESDEL